MNVHENLKAYLDDELTAEERQIVEAALAQDPALQKEMELLKSLATSLQALRKDPQPQGFEATRAALKPKKSPYRLAWQTMSGVAAVCILAALVAPNLKNLTSESSPGTPTVDFTFGSPEAQSATTGEEVYAGPSIAPLAGSSDTASRARTVNPDESNLETLDRLIQEASNKRFDEYTPTGLTVPHSDRQIIKNGNLEVQVDSIRAADQAVKAIAARYNGYIESSYDTAPQNNRPATANYTLRVDAARFENALGDLEALGERLGGSTSGQDVTAQLVDIEARIKTMRAEENQYLELLKETRRVGEILEVKERLFRVRQEIESLEAQRKSLSGLASLSTIHLSLTEKPTVQEPTPSDWFGQTVTRALNLLGSLGRLLAQAAVYLAILAPIWLPVVLFLLWKARRPK